jgi:hypothetical protein
VIEETPPASGNKVAPAQPPAQPKSEQPQGGGGICGGALAIVGLAAGAVSLGLRFAGR